MPRLSLSSTVPRSATAVSIPVTTDAIGDLGPDRSRSAKVSGFEGKVGQTLVLHGAADQPVDVLVGMGASGDVDADVLRRAAAAFVRAVGRHQAAACTLVEAAPSLDTEQAVAAVAEGLGLASYRFVAHKSDPPAETLRRVNVVASGKGARQGFRRGEAAVAAVALARDLSNTPGGELTPAEFVKRADAAAAEAGLKVTVWDERRIARNRFGGLLAVNKGSTNPPRFMIVEYRPKGRAKGSIGLIGKGITFDSGGLSIKTAAGMMTMKIDMAGGAAVVAAMTMLPALESPVAATAYIPLTDNMINGDAQRPGDVFTARNGKTVEVLNTDAEGRLVLADALSYASEQKHDALVDIATLTGSVSAALGVAYMGVMGNDDDLAAAVDAAAARTGEKVWRLPLPPEYRSQIDSSVADIKNMGSGAFGGALVAGLFLQEFVAEGTPWAHLDLGMSAMADADDGVIVKGATGGGVRLLADLVAAWEG